MKRITDVFAHSQVKNAMGFFIVMVLVNTFILLETSVFKELKFHYDDILTTSGTVTQIEEIRDEEGFTHQEVSYLYKIDQLEFENISYSDQTILAQQDIVTIEYITTDPQVSRIQGMGYSSIGLTLIIILFIYIVLSFVGLITSIKKAL